MGTILASAFMPQNYLTIDQGRITGFILATLNLLVHNPGHSPCGIMCMLSITSRLRFHRLIVVVIIFSLLFHPVTLVQLLTSQAFNKSRPYSCTYPIPAPALLSIPQSTVHCLRPDRINLPLFDPFTYEARLVSIPAPSPHSLLKSIML